MELLNNGYRCVYGVGDPFCQTAGVCPVGYKLCHDLGRGVGESWQTSQGRPTSKALGAWFSYVGRSARGLNKDGSAFHRRFSKDIMGSRKALNFAILYLGSTTL